MKSNKKQKTTQRIIADNRKARHDYHLGERFEAGIQLEGWEVKSLRAGRAQLKESYVLLHNGEAQLVSAHISALHQASTHIEPNPTRARKLLLHRKELAKLVTAVQQQGWTIAVLNMHWKAQYVKVDIALAKGKKLHDKREAIKRQDIARESGRLLKG